MTFDEIKKDAPAEAGTSNQSNDQKPSEPLHDNTRYYPIAMKAVRLLAFTAIDHPKADDILWHLMKIVGYLKGEKE